MQTRTSHRLESQNASKIGTDRGAARSSRTNPVVMVHGYRDDASVFTRLAHHLRQAGFQVHLITLKPSDGRAPLNLLAHQVAHYVERNLPGPRPLDFLGFSMGGLVLRYYLQRLNGLERAQRFVTLGSPHNGTWAAYGSNRPGVRQMRPRSPFLEDLAEDVHRLGTIRFTSIWTPLDLTILPARSSELPVGRQVRLYVPYHRALVTDRRVLRRIAQILRE